jgi:kynurenine formamidase
VPRLLSHPVGPATPRFGDDPAPVFTPVSLIENGDVGNWHLVTTLNHMGTHVDAPWHFNPHGLRITGLDMSWWSYDRPVLIDVPCDDGAQIGPADLEPHRPAAGEADMLIVRTGFGRARGDASRYGRTNPSFLPEAADWLLSLPGLRALAIDCPSVACPLHPADGVAFHRAMLGRQATDRFVLLVEDVRLDADLTQDDLSRGIFMAPWLLDGLDAAPVTMVAW